MVIAINDHLIDQIVKDPNYKIFKNGKIKTLITVTGKISVTGKWRLCSYRYMPGSILIRYKHKRLTLHRILYRKFIGKLNSIKVINHKDYNPYNNSLKNLEMISVSDNQFHKYKRKNFVAVATNAKINFAVAEKIREMYRNEKISYKQLSKIFKLAKSTISDIMNYHIWSKQLSSINNVCQGSRGHKDATPSWANIKDLSEVYRKRPKNCVVDHIIPTIHKDICGLHVPWNLQYLSKKENNLKSNKFDYTMNNESWKQTKKSKKRAKSKF